MQRGCYLLRSDTCTMYPYFFNKMVLKSTKKEIPEIQPDFAPLFMLSHTYRDSMYIWDQEISPNLILCINFHTNPLISFKTNGNLTKLSLLTYDQIEIKWNIKIIKGR